MNLFAIILLSTFLMCVPQLTSCKHSKVNKILNLLIIRCFANENLEFFDKSKTTVLKNYKLLDNDQRKNSVEYVKEKLFQVRRLTGCEYIAQSFWILEFFTTFNDICLKRNKEENIEATATCLENFKLCATKANSVLTYFISALDYLENLMEDDLKVPVINYTHELKKIGHFVSNLPELNEAQLSTVGEKLLINEKNISQIDYNINNLTNEIRDLILSECMFMEDMNNESQSDSDEKSSNNKMRIEESSSEEVSDEESSSEEVSDEESSSEEVSNEKLLSKKIWGEELFRKEISNEELFSEQIWDEELSMEEESDESTSSEENSYIYNEDPVQIKEISLRGLDFLIEQFYTKIGFEYDTFNKKTYYKI